MSNVLSLTWPPCARPLHRYLPPLGAQTSGEAISCCLGTAARSSGQSAACCRWIAAGESSFVCRVCLTAPWTRSPTLGNILGIRLHRLGFDSRPRRCKTLRRRLKPSWFRRWEHVATRQLLPTNLLTTEWYRHQRRSHHCRYTSN